MKTNKKNPLPWIISALLLVLLVMAAWQWTKLSAENTAMKQELEEVQSDKTRVKSELADLLVAYEQMESSNTQINDELKKERDKIEKMIAELQQVKASNAVVIARYKREIATLREVMRSFVHQIDSLNTKNQHLEAKINSTEQKYRSVVEEKQALQTHSDSLRNQVQLAEVLRAEGIAIKTLNQRGNTTSRASKAQKVQVIFNLRDNPVAHKGPRALYVRVIHHESATIDRIMENDIQSGIFDFVNENQQADQGGYSAMRTVDYQGKSLQTEIFFDITGQAPSGKYLVQLYSEKRLIGEQNFELR